MKNKRIIDSWNKIEPDNAARERMLEKAIARGFSHCLSNGDTQRSPHRLTKRLATLATAVIILLIATTFAIANYYGSFDRLRGIIGDEQAEKLQPLQVGSVAGEIVTRFHSRDVILEWITDTDFRIELVAVGVEANMIDLYLTIEDLAGNRLSGEILADSQLNPINQNLSKIPSLSSPWPEIIDREDDRIVTFHERITYTEAITTHQFEFILWEIRYGFSTGQFEIDFDLSTVTEQEPVGRVFQTPILQPHLFDIYVDLKYYDSIRTPSYFRGSMEWEILHTNLESADSVGTTRISNIGIIDGRLHVQDRPIPVFLGWYYKLALLCPDGEIVHPLQGSHNDGYSVQFSINEEGRFYSDSGFGVVMDFHYRENVFDVDLERLAEYKLIMTYTTYTQAPFHWMVTFEIE